MDLKNAVVNLKRKHPYLLEQETVEIYTYNVSVAKSNMSAVIRAYAIWGNRPLFLCETRVTGCGLDRGFELAYNIFCEAFPDKRYQDYLRHEWL